MEYKVNELAVMSGVSPRTLRYYDKIDLLKPRRVEENGYRVYGSEQVDMLQQILLYRELGFALEDISDLVASSSFDRQAALKSHLVSLEKKKEQIERLIENVNRTICSINGGDKMTDEEKFEGLKKEYIKSNAEKYGKEVVEKYSLEAFDASNEKLANMNEQQWSSQQALEGKIIELLSAAMKKNDPACEEAQLAADAHKAWISAMWKDGTYSKQAHMCLAESYVADDRFKAYYEERAGEGAAEFLRDAIAVYTK